MGQGNVNPVREAGLNLLQEEAQTMSIAVDVVMLMEMGSAICAEEQEEYKSNNYNQDNYEKDYYDYDSALCEHIISERTNLLL